MQIKLHGTDNKVTLEADGNILVTALSSSTHVTLRCLEINYQPEKKSEPSEIAGAEIVDSKIYKDTFNIVTEYKMLQDIGLYLSNLLAVLRKNYLYIEILDYAFNPFASTKAMPFEVMSFALSTSRKGYKNITMTLEKANGKT